MLSPGVNWRFLKLEVYLYNSNSTSAFFGVVQSPIATLTVVNNGQIRYDFEVAIAGSNGYVSTSIQTPPGYSDGIYLGNSAIYATNDCNGDSTLLYSKFFSTPAFGTTLCSAACDTINSNNLANPPTNGRSARTCQFFNTLILIKNGVTQGQYFAPYSEA
jgi:hypothetical protein